MMQDSQGRIWIGTKTHGVYMAEPTTDKGRLNLMHFSHNQNDDYSLSSNSVYSIMEDSNGHIWFATHEHGLNLWDNGRFINQNNILFNGYDFEPHYVRYITETEDGILLVCSKEGLFTFRSDFNIPEEITLYCNNRKNIPLEISDNDVMYALCAGDGTIYVATNSNGINRIISDDILSNKIEFKHITKIDGLAYDIAFSIVEDKNGLLWIAGETAITCYNPVTDHTEIYDK